MDRFTPDELERRVDEVLFYKWDPVCINHYVTARAEYRSYVPRILSELHSGSPESLLAQLRDIEINHMSLALNECNMKEIVDLLLAHKEAIEKQQA